MSRQLHCAYPIIVASSSPQRFRHSKIGYIKPVLYIVAQETDAAMLMPGKNFHRKSMIGNSQAWEQYFRLWCLYWPFLSILSNKHTIQDVSNESSVFAPQTQDFPRVETEFSGRRTCARVHKCAGFQDEGERTARPFTQICMFKALSKFNAHSAEILRKCVGIGSEPLQSY